MDARRDYLSDAGEGGPDDGGPFADGVDEAAEVRYGLTPLGKRALRRARRAHRGGHEGSPARQPALTLNVRN